jgi:hypothetical protein
MAGQVLVRWGGLQLPWQQTEFQYCWGHLEGLVNSIGGPAVSRGGSAPAN